MSRPSCLKKPSSLATCNGMSTIFGGVVGMPMLSLVCACPLSAAASGAAASNAMVARRIDI